MRGTSPTTTRGIEPTRLARQRYPAANHAAEALVIYPLDRSASAASEVATNDALGSPPAAAPALPPVQEVTHE